MLDVIWNHPAMKRARAAGEERVGKAVAQLLTSERVLGGIEALKSGALYARETLEASLRRTLHAANLPSTDDLEEIKRKLGELEALVEGLAARVGEEPPPSDREKP